MDIIAQRQLRDSSLRRRPGVMTVLPGRPPLTGLAAAIVHDLTDDSVELGSAPANAVPNISTSPRVRLGNVNLSSFMGSPIDGPGTWALGSARAAWSLAPTP